MFSERTRIVKLGSKLPQAEKSVDIAPGTSGIKSTVLKNLSISLHDRQLSHASGKPPDLIETSLDGRKRVILSQLRTGWHSPMLREHLKRIDLVDHDAGPDYGETEDLKHRVLRCPGEQNARFRLFERNLTTDIFWTDPEGVTAYLREIGQTSRPTPMAQCCVVGASNHTFWYSITSCRFSLHNIGKTTP